MNLYVILTTVPELLGIQCGLLCSSIFPILSSPSAVSVGIWKPSSASTPQVGFMSMATSPIQEERFKFQLRRRRKVEVPCSGVPLGSLARFWDGCRLWEINSRVWEWKRIEEITTNVPSMFEKQLDCQLVQVLMFCSCSCPLCEQGAGWLFEIISISEYEFRSDAK